MPDPDAKDRSRQHKERGASLARAGKLDDALAQAAAQATAPISSQPWGFRRRRRAIDPRPEVGQSSAPHVQ